MENEIEMMEKDERSEWVSPSVTDWDIESETQSGAKYPGGDLNSYS